MLCNLDFELLEIIFYFCKDYFETKKIIKGILGVVLVSQVL